MYAVIETGGKQYRVKSGDTLEIERVATEAGKTHTFDRVLLTAIDGRVSIGAPTLGSARVTAGFTAAGVALREGGELSDLAPTILALLGLPIPDEMTGASLTTPS